MRLIDANNMNWETCPVGGYAIKEWISEQPTIDPESLRAKGRWERIGERYENCTYCGTIFEALPTQYFFETNNRFCRNCGAKMEE